MKVSKQALERKRIMEFNRKMWLKHPDSKCPPVPDPGLYNWDYIVRMAELDDNLWSAIKITVLGFVILFIIGGLVI